MITGGVTPGLAVFRKRPFSSCYAKMKVTILVGKDKKVVLELSEAATVADLQQAFHKERKAFYPSRQAYRCIPIGCIVIYLSDK